VSVVCFCGHGFNFLEVAAADEFYGNSEACEDSSGAFDCADADSGAGGDGVAGGGD
jgi:hypothetical protein